ncbi:hypothetical protein [Streptomyces chattanoogensis]|uniref:hypothetical protein n=1 Tax=Streptomyces chattanoogensis TaxID=66876 RepID=UPI0036BF73C6
MTTGLLVAAAALPVPLATTALAAEQRAAPLDRPSHLVQGHALPDGYAADPPLAGNRAGEGRGHPGRPESLEYLPGVPRPDADMHIADLPVLRDFFAHIPDETPRYPDEPPEYLPWHDPRYGLDPDDSSPDDDPDAPGPEDSPSSSPESPSDEAQDPGRPAPSDPPPAPPRSAAPGPSPGPHSDVAGGLGHRPYKPLQPPSPSKKRHHTPPDDAEPADPAEPYAMETPTAPVERVLPMGAGLALTGLGLAFLGLRLRRR